MKPSLLRRLGTLTASVTLAIGALIAAPTPTQALDVYIEAGTHTLNGRQWRTECSPYSATERCRTEIWATQVKYEKGRFIQTTGWVFNNLTYKASPRELWKGNPIAASGKVGGTATWTATDGRKWRTECDTAITGRGGCRSYVEASVIAKTASGFEWRKSWILNNMLRFSPAKQAPAQTFDFIADPALRGCAKELLGTKPLGSLEMLICNGKAVKSLEGIERLTGLTSVQLIDNEITNLAPLAKLPKLRQIEVHHNLIEDLMPLARVTGLWHLMANDNYIDDLTPLKGLSDLYTLEVGDNVIHDLTPLADKKKLSNLNLYLNEIDDISVLTGLTNLEHLNLSDNYIDDLTPLKTLSRLRGLDAEDNFVGNLGPLAGLTNLEILYLRGNALGDVAPLKGLTKLKQLWLANNPNIINLDRLQPLVANGCDIDILPAT